MRSLVLAVIVASSAFGAELKLDVEEVVFHAKATGLAIEGTTKAMTGTREGESVRLKVDLKTLETGLGLRDTHTKNYLEVDKFPNAELVVASSLLKAGVAQTGQGKFTVHGVTSDVTVTYDVKKVPTGFAVQAKFPISIKAFGIKPPSYGAVKVKDDVVVEANFIVAE